MQVASDTQCHRIVARVGVVAHHEQNGAALLSLLEVGGIEPLIPELVAQKRGCPGTAFTGEVVAPLGDHHIELEVVLPLQRAHLGCESRVEAHRTGDAVVDIGVRAVLEGGQVGRRAAFGVGDRGEEGAAQAHDQNEQEAEPAERQSCRRILVCHIRFLLWLC